MTLVGFKQFTLSNVMDTYFARCFNLNESEHAALLPLLPRNTIILILKEKS